MGATCRHPRVLRGNRPRVSPLPRGQRQQLTLRYDWRGGGAVAWAQVPGWLDPAPTLNADARASAPGAGGPLAQTGAGRSSPVRTEPQR
jgi:hypothetical protein